MRFVYCHGFASGPQSRKAQAFREALATRGMSLEIPCLDGGDFEHLTISGQLRTIHESLEDALYAAAHPEVERLVLLAPAFGFGSRWRKMQGPEVISRWRDTGWLEVFHYGARDQRRVHYGLLEDAANFPGFPDLRQPVLIFHGTDDPVVPVSFSREFVASHLSARLREMDSDHELLNVLDLITSEALPFLLS